MDFAQQKNFSSNTPSKWRECVINVIVLIKVFELPIHACNFVLSLVLTKQKVVLQFVLLLLFLKLHSASKGDQNGASWGNSRVA